MIDIQALYNLPKYSVYGLINHQDKKVYITHTSDTINSVVRLLEDIKHSVKHKSMRDDLSKLEFVLLEDLYSNNIGADNLASKLRRQYHIDQYTEMGYSMYIPNTPVNYTIQYSVLNDFREAPSDKPLANPLVYVKLVCNRRIGRIIGVYNTMTAAKSFVNANYNGQIYYIRYGDNQLTQEYLQFLE